MLLEVRDELGTFPDSTALDRQPKTWLDNKNLSIMLRSSDTSPKRWSPRRIHDTFGISGEHSPLSATTFPFRHSTDETTIFSEFESGITVPGGQQEDRMVNDNDVSTVLCSFLPDLWLTSWNWSRIFTANFQAASQLTVEFIHVKLEFSLATEDQIAVWARQSQFIRFSGPHIVS